jgi:hypothetical protein
MRVVDWTWWLWHGGLWFAFSVSLGILAIYWHGRAKRAEKEQGELHDELVRIAALLKDYRRNYYGDTGEVIKEIVERLSNGLPHFGALFKPEKS